MKVQRHAREPRAERDLQVRQPVERQRRKRVADRAGAGGEDQTLAQQLATS